ncbi:MAG: DMT family transporter [bacterium]
MNFTKSKYFGEAVLLLVTFFWGVTFVAVKSSLKDISPMLFLAIRFSIAAILFLPLLYNYRDKLNLKSVLPGLLLGVLIFLSFAAQTTGLQFTTATKSGFLTGSLVVMVPFFQLIIKKKKPTKGAVIGILFVFAGIFILSSGGKSIYSFLDELGSDFNIGDVLTLVCAVIFAVEVVYLDIFSSKYNLWVLVFSQLAVTAILGFVFAFIFNATNFEPYKLSFTSNLFVGLIYTAVFATLINTILQTKYQKSVSPAKAGIIYSFEPIFSAIFAFILLNETMNELSYIGCLLIFVGLALSEIFDNIMEKRWKTNYAELK